MTCYHLHHFVFVDVVLTVPSELLSAAAHNRSINNSAAPVMCVMAALYISQLTAVVGTPHK